MNPAIQLLPGALLLVVNAIILVLLNKKRRQVYALKKKADQLFRGHQEMYEETMRMRQESKEIHDTWQRLKQNGWR